MRELGYDWEQTSWRALMVHRDTPDEIVRQLKGSSRDIYIGRSKKGCRELENSYLDGGRANRNFLREEVARYRKMAEELGMLIHR